MNAPHPLSRLIQSIEDGQGWTDREVSRRIEVAGHKMSHSYIGKLKNHPIQSVTASMIQTLAIGLRVPEAVVAAAAMESMGVHIDTNSSAGLDVAIANEPSLTDYDKRLLRSVVKEMRTDGEERGDNSTGDTDRENLPDPAQRDGATTDTAHKPLPKDSWALAARRSEHLGKPLDDAMDAAGEESQDPDGV